MESFTSATTYDIEIEKLEPCGIDVSNQQQSVQHQQHQQVIKSNVDCHRSSTQSSQDNHNKIISVDDTETNLLSGQVRQMHINNAQENVQCESIDQPECETPVMERRESVESNACNDDPNEMTDSFYMDKREKWYLFSMRMAYLLCHEMRIDQRILAEKVLYDVLRKGELGTLNSDLTLQDIASHIGANRSKCHYGVQSVFMIACDIVADLRIMTSYQQSIALKLINHAILQGRLGKLDRYYGINIFNQLLSEQPQQHQQVITSNVACSRSSTQSSQDNHNEIISVDDTETNLQSEMFEMNQNDESDCGVDMFHMDDSEEWYSFGMNMAILLCYEMRMGQRILAEKVLTDVLEKGLLGTLNLDTTLQDIASHIDANQNNIFYGEDRVDIIAMHIISNFRKITSSQQPIAEKLISHAIFQGRLGELFRFFEYNYVAFGMEIANALRVDMRIDQRILAIKLLRDILLKGQLGTLDSNFTLQDIVSESEYNNDANEMYQNNNSYTGDFDVIGKSVASTLRNMRSDQRAIAELLLVDVMSEGRFGRLDRIFSEQSIGE